MIKTTRDGGKTNGKKEKRNRFKNLRIAANGKYRGQTGKELVRNPGVYILYFLEGKKK